MTPTIGMLLPGYFLIVSRQHVLSYAELTSEELAEIEEYCSRIVAEMTPLFGDYLLFEHGPSRAEAASHGGCIAHAHFHLIPAASKLRSQLLDALKWERLQGLRDLPDFAADSAYSLFQVDGELYASDDSTPMRQWIRRQVAEGLQLPVEWDWATYSGETELRDTLAALAASRRRVRTSR